MGISLTGPSYIFADNKSQVTSSTIPESTLKNKCNSICYHAVQESVAMGESLITHIKSDDNLSDLMTNVTCGRKTVDWLVTSFMTSMMTILNIEARPANPDQSILRGLKKSPVATCFTYLRLTFWLKGWSIRKILLQARHQKSARQAGHILGTLCSLVSCLQV